MKKMILCAAMLLSIAVVSQAQAIKSKTGAKTQAGKMSMSKRMDKAGAQEQDKKVYRSVSTAEYAAKSGLVQETPSQYTIADPMINALNAKARGSDIRISKSGIVGMPKRAYGFANGHLTLYTTGTTSSGTITGSGAVGTGSSLGSIGSEGAGIAVNGKSPYAGTAMWGNARGLTILNGDSSVRMAGRKKEK
jgi:hypothetical protein